jgi:hypothetical protein
MPKSLVEINIFVYLYTFFSVDILLLLAHQCELFVSKGDGPASVVHRHASTILFFSETDLPQICSVASLWQSHINLPMSFQLAPFRGQHSYTYKKCIKHLLLSAFCVLNLLMDYNQTLSVAFLDSLLSNVFK